MLTTTRVITSATGMTTDTTTFDEDEDAAVILKQIFYIMNEKIICKS